MRKIVLLIALSISFLTQAQESKKPKVEDIQARKWQFIVEKAQLSADEAEKAQPIFMEYEQAVWKLMEQNKSFFHRSESENKNKSKMNYEENNERFINFESQKAFLLKGYYSKLKKNLSAESIYKIFNAERSFRKELIKDWQRKGGSSNHKKPNFILQNSIF